MSHISTASVMLILLIPPLHHILPCWISASSLNPHQGVSRNKTSHTGVGDIMRRYVPLEDKNVSMLLYILQPGSYVFIFLDVLALYVCIVVNVGNTGLKGHDTHLKKQCSHVHMYTDKVIGHCNSSSCPYYIHTYIYINIYIHTCVYIYICVYVYMYQGCNNTKNCDI